MRSIAKITIILSVYSIIGSAANAGIIWDGPTIVFTKANFADWTLSQNQDRLTSDVWITRADAQGLFNIAQETAFTDLGDNTVSPVGTEWAYGVAADWPSLTFEPWDIWAADHPPLTVGQNAVLHLIAADAYVDIKFLSWTSGNGAGSTGGGGFSYQRSTAPVPEPDSINLLFAGALGLLSFTWMRR